MSTLKEKFKERIHELISIAEIEKRNRNQYLKKITQIKLQSLSDSANARPIIPVFAFSSTIIRDIDELKGIVPMKTIKEVINLIVECGKDVHAKKVSNEYEFYDIDEELDILSLNNEKR